MFSNVMSVFDATTYGGAGSWWVVWVGNFLFLFLYVVISFLVKISRSVGGLEEFLALSLMMVRKSTLGALGGSHLLLGSLLLVILMCNVTGIVPYTLSVSSHLVYSVSFALPFWLGLVLSSVVWGKGLTSMAGLALGGLPLLMSGFMCWFELLSIFLRWITLAVRLSANMTIGQIVISLMSSYQVESYFCSGSSVVMSVVALASCFVLAAEVVVCFLQTYVFCLLLSVYSSDHSL